MKLQGRREFWQGLLTAINEAQEDAVRIVTRQLRIVDLDAERIARGLKVLTQKERQQIGAMLIGKDASETTIGDSARRRIPVQSWVKK